MPSQDPYTEAVQEPYQTTFATTRVDTSDTSLQTFDTTKYEDVGTTINQYNFEKNNNAERIDAFPTMSVAEKELISNAESQQYDSDGIIMPSPESFQFGTDEKLSESPFFKDAPSTFFGSMIFPTTEAEATTIEPTYETNSIESDILKAPVESTPPTTDFTTPPPPTVLSSSDFIVQTPPPPTIQSYNPFLYNQNSKSSNVHSSPLPPPTLLPYSTTRQYTLFDQPQPTQPVNAPEIFLTTKSVYPRNRSKPTKAVHIQGRVRQSNNPIASGNLPRVIIKHVKRPKRPNLKNMLPAFNLAKYTTASEPKYSSLTPASTR